MEEEKARESLYGGFVNPYEKVNLFKLRGPKRKRTVLQNKGCKIEIRLGQG